MMSRLQPKQILFSALIFVRSAAIILICLFLGTWLQTQSNLPISGSIIGLLLLFISLITGVVKLDHVLPAGKLLLQYLVLFFVPVGVGLLNYLDLLSQHWLAIVISGAASTVIVLVVIGWLFQRLSK